MKAKIKIDMDNAAFEDGFATELARILKELASDIADGSSPFGKTLYDANGNRVGSFEVTK